MSRNRKIPSEREMMDRLRSGPPLLHPLEFQLRARNIPADLEKKRIDGIVRISWGKKRADFAVECRAHFTPKPFEEGLRFLKALRLPKGMHPLLYRVYLSDDQLATLEEEGISGVDMCGNGVVMIPGVFSVNRSGNPNVFSSPAQIKNIYRKNASMAARVFLAVPEFSAVGEVCEAINDRNMLVQSATARPMTLSTVSKTLKSLEEDLILSRRDGIRLLQPDALLARLLANYVEPVVRQRIGLRAPGTMEEIRAAIANAAGMRRIPFVASGLSSAGQYAVMQRGDRVAVYTPSATDMMKALSAVPDDRFPNIDLIETLDERMYFDARAEDEFRWASPVQTWLELMRGDSRDKVTAEQVEHFIVSEIERRKEK